MTEAEEQLREHIATWLLPGFNDRDTVETWALELSEDAEEPLTEPAVRELVAELWRDRMAEQEKWPAVTDADRLASAFERLVSGGFVARMNFTCCQTCGTAEIGDERPDSAVGYTFFHSQDAEGLADQPAYLYLSYGSFEPSRLTAEDAGRQVAGALEAAGLNVDWDGSVDRRIGVGPLDWRRRLPT